MKSIRTITAAALLASVAVSCAKWTEPQPIEIRKPSLENSPELYSRYCQAIRDYKKSEHKMMYVTFDNVESSYDQSCNLTSLPDSVDFVEISNPGLTASIADQMAKLRADKGFRFAVSVSMDAIDSDYESLVAGIDAEYAERLAEAGGDASLVPAPEYPEKSAFVAEAVKEAFARADEFGYEAVRVQYTGYSPFHLTSEQKEQYVSEQTEFFSLIGSELEARPSLLYFLNVNPEFIVSADILKAADHVVLPTQGSTGTGDLDLFAIRSGEVLSGMSLLYAVTTITDDFKTGWLTSGEQIPLVSAWMTVPAEYSKDGMVVLDVRRAFYDDNRNVYRKIRNAIGNMNPNS